MKQKKNLINRIKKYISKIDLGKTKFNTLEMILISIMALVFGILIGEAIFSNSTVGLSVKSSSSQELNEIKNVYNTILNEYVNKVDSEKLKNAAISGMFSVLEDKHSSYIDKDSSENYEDELNGYFYGMGAAVYQKKGEPVTIAEVYKNSPAEKAGLKVGDQYLKINGEDVSKLTSEDISNKIKGTNNKEFKLTILRNGKEKTIKVTTGKVELQSVKKEIIEKEDKKIAYLTLTIFANNTDEQLKKALKELKKDNIKNIVLDLRYNQGGELDTVLNIASEFLDEKAPIIQIVGKSGTDKKYSTGNENPDYNIVVLINAGSASASEVLSAALNEQLNVPLIGETTYGKGTVQKTKKLSDGSIIKYTTETWKTSKGNSIEKIGIKPTIEVKQSEKYYETGSNDDDVQLQKAIAELLK